MYLRYDRLGRLNTIPMPILLLVACLDRGLEVAVVYHFSMQLGTLLIRVWVRVIWELFTMPKFSICLQHVHIDRWGQLACELRLNTLALG